MKQELKGFVAGVLVMAVGMGTAYAAGGIQTAEFNSNKVSFNGKQLELSQPMISVVKEGDANASNYMPVRAVLEAMGYQVDWDSQNNTVVIRGHNKEVTYDYIGENGTTIKNMINSKLGIDIDALRTQGVFDNLEGILKTSDPEVICILMVDDYNTWLNNGESMFPEIWEAFYGNK